MRCATARMASNKCSPCGARGSACTITSDGTISPMRFSIASLSACTCSSPEQVHALRDAIEKRIGEIVQSDVMVHAEPRAPQGEHLFEAIRAVAQRSGLAIHDVTALQQDGKLFIELHMEVDENLSLREAHRQATEL